MGWLFTSESVSEGHPDKMADQISDSILDELLMRDSKARVACEVLIADNEVIVRGEITTVSTVDISRIVRNAIRDIGYTKESGFDPDSCIINTKINEQSPDISRGVNNKGAGDQGIMFGYANRETKEFMPMPITLSHRLMKRLSIIRKEESQIMDYLLPDSKAQVTVEYEKKNVPKRIHTIVLSTQHKEFSDDRTMQKHIVRDIKSILLQEFLPKELLDNDTNLYINPTGRFVKGGPSADTGLTGRKIIVDTYGGKAPHGGGAFSGKDPSKVDRSASYALRHIAKNIVAANIADEVLLQLAYAIGKAEPLGLYLNTYNTSKIKMKDSEIAAKLYQSLDLTPESIIKNLDLEKPIFKETSNYGHMGREPVTKNYESITSSEIKEKITFFPWEKIDITEKLLSIL